MRYSLEPDSSNHEVNKVLFQANLILQGIGAFALSLTINHQRRYRSSAPARPNTTGQPGEEDNLLGRTETGWLKAISLLEVMFAFLFLVYLVFLYLALM